MTAFFKNFSTNQIILLGIVVSVIAVVLVFSGAISAPEVPRVQASASDNMSGFAWSSNFGWISFNRTDCDANNDGLSDGAPAGCPPSGTSIPNYGVNLDSVTKFLTGYAWYGWDDGGTNQGGWIRFGGLTGFPTGGGTSAQNAQLNASNQLIGWARALSATGAQAGGWDGWISLRGIADDGSTYGVVLNGNSFKEYSWDGSNNVITVPPAADQFDGVGIGWIQWNPPFGGVVLNIAAPTASLTASPLIIETGNSSTLTWSSTNAVSCTGTNFSTGGAISGNTSVSPTVTTTYTVTCQNLTGQTAQDSKTVTVLATADLVLTPSRSSVDPGDSVTLTWTSTSVADDSCSLTSNETDPLEAVIAPPTTGLPANLGSPGKEVTNIQNTTTFTITCKRTADNTDIDDTARVLVERLIHD